MRRILFAVVAGGDRCAWLPCGQTGNNSRRYTDTRNRHDPKDVSGRSRTRLRQGDTRRRLQALLSHRQHFQSSAANNQPAAISSKSSYLVGRPKVLEPNQVGCLKILLDTNKFRGPKLCRLWLTMDNGTNRRSPSPLTSDKARACSRPRKYFSLYGALSPHEQDGTWLSTISTQFKEESGHASHTLRIVRARGG